MVNDYNSVREAKKAAFGQYRDRKAELDKKFVERQVALAEAIRDKTGSDCSAEMLEMDQAIKLYQGQRRQLKEALASRWNEILSAHARDTKPDHTDVSEIMMAAYVLAEPHNYSKEGISAAIEYLKAKAETILNSKEGEKAIDASPMAIRNELAELRDMILAIKPSEEKPATDEKEALEPAPEEVSVLASAHIAMCLDLYDKKCLLGEVLAHLAEKGIMPDTELDSQSRLKIEEEVLNYFVLREQQTAIQPQMESLPAVEAPVGGQTPAQPVVISRFDEKGFVISASTIRYLADTEHIEPDLVNLYLSATICGLKLGTAKAGISNGYFPEDLALQNIDQMIRSKGLTGKVPKPAKILNFLKRRGIVRYPKSNAVSFESDMTRIDSTWRIAMQSILNQHRQITSRN